MNPLPSLLLSAALAAAPTWTSSTLRAQSAPEFQETVQVTEVLLDVLVTDRKGNVILGLGPDDFVVEEKKRGEVEITDASFYSHRLRLPADTGEAQPASTDDGIVADRYFVVFFHDVRRLDEPDRRLLRQQMVAAGETKEWIATGLSPGDWVAVASWDSKLKIHQDFSQDSEELIRAVDDAVIGKDPGNIWPTRRETGHERPSILCHLPSGNELRDATPRMYDALEVLAEATGPIVGRKNVLLFTIGFGEIRPGFLSRPDQRYYPGMKRSLNDHNVALYPIDLTPPRSEHAQTHFLQQVADETGGFYWRTFVGFHTPLAQISEENSGYYLLSYRSTHPAGESGYQEVEVRTRDRSLRVRSRNGYEYGS